MKIKTIHYLLFFYSVLMAKEVRINVVDETGVPISRADASIYFMHPRNDDQRDGITDETGSFSVSGTGSLGVGLMVKKNGYYPARMEGLSKKSDHNFSVVLPRVLNPIALYAWRSSGLVPHLLSLLKISGLVLISKRQIVWLLMARGGR